ncbi:cobalamin biosynthesis protein CobU [Clostridiaceae bacterium]|nr:cobalamin biosynthesis protein CobU [Clostridiaceae bacterium]RKI10419.1 cobalamin biosynthesis protein CobU [bacterium 1XD21-70]
MILIIGGMSQGKKEFARQLAGVGAPEFGADLADGWADPPQSALQKPYLASFHGWIRRILEEGGDPDVFVGQVLAAEPRIITMDEVGCGIVPVERTERDYREAVGHAGQKLAGSAGEVYRMVCGIPQKIKG